MNEPPKPKCQMGDGDLKSQIFRDTFPRQLAPERDGVNRGLKEIVNRACLNLGKSGRSRCTALVAQLDYFNIQRTEKYSTERCASTEHTWLATMNTKLGEKGVRIGGTGPPSITMNRNCGG